MPSLDLTYPSILNNFSKQVAAGRTESRAFLAWFLENYYHLEDFQAQDAICDGPDDKGIDGIYVDQNFERIDIFQSKLVQNAARTLGDTQLKEFVGTLGQFTNPKAVEQLASTTGNSELRNLIINGGVLARLNVGYSVRGVFLTNAARDSNATAYLTTRSDLILYDANELESLYVPAGPSPRMMKAVTFDLFGYDVAEYKTGHARVIIAPLRSLDLIQMEGIGSGELFAWNVRQSLGRTKVNKDIEKSILDVTEHPNFLLYHNGLTILCESLEHTDDKITMNGYAVVNGCQSLTSLYDRRDKLTGDLRILARLIQLDPRDELVEKISHHSNNQNSISPRDLQSNSAIQRRLQNEFARKFGGQIFYRIKRGETSDAPEIIDNEDAGRNLLAFDREEPWSCHQTYRVFDELYQEIFARPEVDVDRVLALHDAYQVVEQCLPNIEDGLLGNYKLTRYFLLFLLKQALKTDEIGKRFCASPGSFLREADGRNRVRKALTIVLRDLIVDLNGEVKERRESGTPLDYKSEFKSPKTVRELARAVTSMYQKTILRGRLAAFGAEWESKKVTAVQI